MNISKTPSRPSHSHIHQALEEASRTREMMLTELPESTDDVVIEAQRFSIERVLHEVRSALARLESGSYGTCPSCKAQIPLERLELRPWAAFCVRCAER
jgi:DnaK suppressor protein